MGEVCFKPIEVVMPGTLAPSAHEPWRDQKVPTGQDLRELLEFISSKTLAPSANRSRGLVVNRVVLGQQRATFSDEPGFNKQASISRESARLRMQLIAASAEGLAPSARPWLRLIGLQWIPRFSTSALRPLPLPRNVRSLRHLVLEMA